MAKQTYTSGQVLSAAQMTTLQANDYNQTVSAKVASYTLVAADAGTRITMSNASATTITVNTGLFAAGDTLYITNIGAGVSTITAGTATVSTISSLALAQYDSGVLYFTSTGVAIWQKYDGAPAGAGGSMTLISTTTLTGATVTLSSIPQTYKDLRMELKDFLHTGGGNNTVQFRVNSTSSIYDTNNSSEAGPAAAYTLTYGELTGGYTQPAVTDNFSVSEFYDYTNTTTYKYVDTKNMGSAGATSYATENLRTGIRSTSAISAIELSLAAGSFNGGTVLLYGVN
jgi:hypothetical protein